LSTTTTGNVAGTKHSSGSYCIPASSATYDVYYCNESPGTDQFTTAALYSEFPSSVDADVDGGGLTTTTGLTGCTSIPTCNVLSSSNEYTYHSEGKYCFTILKTPSSAYEVDPYNYACDE